MFNKNNTNTNVKSLTDEPTTIIIDNRLTFPNQILPSNSSLISKVFNF